LCSRLANDLVDAMSTFTVPVVLGRGKKLFADGSAPHSYALTRSRVSATGLVIAHYERRRDIQMVTQRSIHRAMLNGRVRSG
jgi:dihydrofolate reductase